MKRKSLVQSCGVVLLVAVWGLGCGGSSSDEQESYLLEELNSNLQQWQEKKIDHYSFEFERTCFCPSEIIRTVVIEVNNAQITSAQYKDDGTQVAAENLQYFMTIEQIFETIRKAIKEADEITVGYQPDLGYPESIAIDYIEEAMDDEVSFSIASLKNIE